MLSTQLKGVLPRFSSANGRLSGARAPLKIKASPLASAKPLPLSLRAFSTSPRPLVKTNADKEYHEGPRGVPSTEYHRTSTRYTNTSSELLRILTGTNQIKHKHPGGLMDKTALNLVKFLRWASDLYFKDNLIYRAMMLETVAAVPGMVAGMIHHLRSLRTVQHDNWIRTLLDEAENERMHLFCWIDVLKPTWSQRLLIVSVQAVFFAVYLAMYMFFPKSSHRFVGYLEEEAYKTYTHMLHMIDEGKIKDRPAPQLAIDYWNMPANATMRDMAVIIREDEHDHAMVNHSMANMIEGLRKRDVVYSEISIDDSVFDPPAPGTAIADHGQIQAISKSAPDASTLKADIQAKGAKPSL